MNQLAAQQKHNASHSRLVFETAQFIVTSEAAAEATDYSLNAQPDAALLQMIRQGLDCIAWIPADEQEFQQPLEYRQSPETATTYLENVPGHWRVGDQETTCACGAFEMVEDVLGDARVVDDVYDDPSNVLLRPTTREIQIARTLGYMISIEHDQIQVGNGTDRPAEMVESGFWFYGESVHRTLDEALDAMREGGSTTWWSTYPEARD